MDADARGYDIVDWRAFVVTTAAVLVVYFSTLTPDVSLGFSGIFSTAAMYGGVPHPPGYPVAVWWQGLFVHLLPVSNIAWRVAVSSAVAGALACGLIALLVSRLGRESLTRATRVRIVCGFVAGTSFGFNGAFWGRAVIADVWTLSICLFCGVLCLLLRWCFTPGRTRYLYLSAFVYGLTLTNSQILLAAAPAIPGLLLLAQTRPILLRWRTVLGCSAALALGLTPYVYVPVASMTNPPMNWGYPRTVSGFYHVISRGQYERIQPTSEMTAFAKQMAMYGTVTVKEFGWPLLVALLPWLFFGRIPPRERAGLLAWLVLYLCLTLLLIAVLNPVDYLDGRRMIKVFFSASYVVLAVWVGLGLMKLAQLCGEGATRRGDAAGGEMQPSQGARG